MAHIAKSRKRALIASCNAKAVGVGYGNIAFPGMEENKHVSVHIGDATVRIEFSALPALIAKLQATFNEHVGR